MYREVSELFEHSSDREGLVGYANHLNLQIQNAIDVLSQGNDQIYRDVVEVLQTTTEKGISSWPDAIKCLYMILRFRIFALARRTSSDPDGFQTIQERALTEIDRPRVEYYIGIDGLTEMLKSLIMLLYKPDVSHVVPGSLI